MTLPYKPESFIVLKRLEIAFIVFQVWISMKKKQRMSIEKEFGLFFFFSFHLLKKKKTK